MLLLDPMPMATTSTWHESNNWKHESMFSLTFTSSSRPLAEQKSFSSSYSKPEMCELFVL